MSSPKLRSFLHNFYASPTLLCFVITEKLSHETDKIVISEQHPSWHIHLGVVGARVCMSFWNCDISHKERTVKHVVMCFFLNNQRIVSHTSHFRAHSHYQPAQDSYFIYQFSSSSSLPFPFKHTVICLIYMLEYVCMLLYCVVLSVYFFFWPRPQFPDQGFNPGHDSESPES